MSKKNKNKYVPPLMQVYLDQQTAPKISENAVDNWINYGSGEYKNLYPQFIIDLYNSSPTHAAVINATAAMIAGEGITIAEDADKNLDAYVKLKKFIGQANRNETLHEVITKISFDLKLQGGFALNIIWSKDRTAISEISHVPVENVRSGKPNELGIVEYYYISSDWNKYRKAGHTPQEIPAFNTNNRTEPSQLLYKGLYSPGMQIYHVPDYQAGTNWALTDQLISEFHLSNIRNGFSPSFWINFNNGTPTDEQRHELERKIQQKFTGSTNAGKFILSFSDEKSKEPTLQPISLSDAHEQYQTLNTLCVQNIMIAHRVTSPMLLGVKSASQLGGRTELLDAYELYHNTVIKNFQSVIVKCLKHILDINNININIDIQKAAPLNNRFGPDVLKEVMTINELRAELGLPELTEEDQTVAEENLKKKKKKKYYNTHKCDCKKLAKVGDIDGMPVYDTKEEAEEKAKELGCSGSHTHTYEGRTVFMPCADHEQTVNLSKDKKQKFEDLVKILSDLGEDEEEILKDYDFLSKEDVEDEDENTDYEALLNEGRTDLANVKTGKGYPNRTSKQDGTNADGDLFRVRYIYTGKATGERDFCKAMLAANKVYRKEDIKAMSRMAVNPGFGPGGKNTYSIWLHKGGVNCYHKFFRKIYIQKGNRATNKDEVVSTTEARRRGFQPEPNEQLVPVAPIDTPTKGRLK